MQQAVYNMRRAARRAMGMADLPPVRTRMLTYPRKS
jgi:hypothetical protein